MVHIKGCTQVIFQVERNDWNRFIFNDDIIHLINAVIAEVLVGERIQNAVVFPILAGNGIWHHTVCVFSVYALTMTVQIKIAECDRTDRCNGFKKQMDGWQKIYRFFTGNIRCQRWDLLLLFFR